MSCDWEWGSDLHACLVLPRLGRQLMNVALREWPIRFADALPIANGPRVTLIIAHGGRSRLPQLIRTIRSSLPRPRLTWKLLSSINPMSPW